MKQRKKTMELVAMISCKVELATNYKHNRDDSHTATKYIKSLYFESKDFTFYFYPRFEDVVYIKQFVKEALTKHEAHLLLYDDTSIEFTVSRGMMDVTLNWSTRPGGLEWRCPFDRWTDSLKEINTVLEELES